MVIANQDKYTCADGADLPPPIAALCRLSPYLSAAQRIAMVGARGGMHLIELRVTRPSQSHAFSTAAYCASFYAAHLFYSAHVSVARVTVRTLRGRCNGVRPIFGWFLPGYPATVRNGRVRQASDH